MSVQLILYPQNNDVVEYVTDGIDFNTIDFAINFDISTSSTVNFYQNILSGQAAATGSWRRFRNIVNGTMALPDGTGGTCVFNALTQSNLAGRSGIYQGLSGLTIGDSYTVDVKYTTGSGFIQIAHTDGTTGNSSAFEPLANLSTTTTFTYQFDAISANDTLFLTYISGAASNFILESISVRATNVSLFEGQVICDLYEDEEIPLTLSVDDFKNVAEKVQSYSKDFNLPATKRNNKIFGSIFEITTDVGSLNSFNPYITTRAVLKQNGLMLFDGALKLIDIQDREGEISYNVNLFAQTIALADTLKNKTFDDINFDELQHTYDKTSIKASWFASTGLPLTNPLPSGTYAGTAGASTTQVLKYPFVDWTGQILIANGATGNAATAGNPELTSFEQAFRPFIKIKYLIDRIFSEADYTYTSTLFNQSGFANLYMDFNWGGDTMPSVIGDNSFTATYAAGTGAPVVNSTGSYETLPLIANNMTGGQTTSFVPPDFQTTGSDIYKIVATTDNQVYNIDYSWFVTQTGGVSADLEFRWQHEDASTGNTNTFDFLSIASFVSSTSKSYAGSLQIALDTGDKLYAQFRIQSGGSFQDVQISQTNTSTVTFNLTSSLVTTSTINSKRGELNQWEFLRGIFTMFNLITLEDKSNPGNIIIERYSDVFANIGDGTSLADRGIKHNWTDKVDIKDIKLKPLNDLKKITTFRFEEDEDDFIFSVYKRSTNGHLYGSKVFSAAGFTVLEGEAEIIASPFAATVSKPIGQSFTDMIIPTIYSVDDDGQPSGFDNMPRILYNTTGSSPKTLTSSSYYMPAQNGTSSENVTTFFTFSHLTDIPTISTTNDFNFGECQLISPIGSSVTSNLFNNNWLPYYNELYNSNTKVMVLKVNLTPGDIATFEFSDMVMIKNRAYRVNRIDYKPKDLSTVEFILIP